MADDQRIAVDDEAALENPAQRQSHPERHEDRPNPPKSPEPYQKIDDGGAGNECRGSDDVAFIIQETNKRLSIEIQKNARLEGILSETEQHFIDQMRKAREEKAELEATVHKLTAEKTRLMSDLEESKNVLFELRPEEQISDAEIQRRYTELCDAIETWIDLATDGDDAEDFCARFLKQYKRMKKPNPLYNSLGDLEDEFPSLMEHDNFDYFVLTALVQQQLDSEMAVRYPIGISQTVLMVLKEVQRGMTMLEPPKDKSYIETWRSSALAALVTIPEISEARDARAEEATQTLIALIKPLLSKSADIETLESKLLANVLKPAFELTQTMCISTHRYAIRYPKKVAGANYRNLDGWTAIKKLEQIERVVRRLHPALLLLDKGEHFPIVLAKPVVVVSCREGFGGSP
ncbi:MAG: hypothetical protein M1840_006949 [Geoglossum simile]|nr:MAG: hypothetical protein M1840_006949 [Geoglossum simile]